VKRYAVEIAADWLLAADAGASDVALWDALQVANVPVLLMVLAQITGDRRWLKAPYTPSRTRGMDDNDTGGLPPEIQVEIRRAAFEVLRHDNAGKLPEPPSPESMAALMAICMGEDIPAEYGGLMLEEMGAIARQPAWIATPDPDAVTAFRVIVIGAGVSGVCAAIALRRAGIPFVVLERSPSVGGTWFENKYPGCAVDTPSHLYSFSFARRNWSRYFAPQDEIRDYIEECVDRFGVRDAIRLGMEVLSASFDDKNGCWTVEVRRSDGTRETLGANAVISAVGQLNEPATPEIAGAERFAGPIVHSARWPDDLDVTGKKVVVIGSGASAMQIVPSIAESVEQVTVFQRSPQWAASATNYKREVPPGVRYLMQHCPLYAAWYRCRLVWSYSDKVHESLQIDPDWPDKATSINAINDGHRRFFTRHIIGELGDRSDLLSKVLPKYPPFAKRMLIDNGWFRTMTRENVELVDAGILEIVDDGVVDGHGVRHPADVVVYATGFQTLRMVGSYNVRGRNGTSLRSLWGEDDARGYLGITVRGFPNFFCLYGPNTGLGHGGSLILLTECATRYIVSLIQRMIVDQVDAIDVKETVFNEYNAAIDAAHEKMIWNHLGATNWYRNARGRVVTNMPWRVVDYWQMTHDPDLADYDVDRMSERVEPSKGRL
jgi:4-hydroxyacetophenone monooxygenase